MTIYPATHGMPPAALGCAAATMIAVEMLRRANAVPDLISFVKPCCDQAQFALLAARH